MYYPLSDYDSAPLDTFPETGDPVVDLFLLVLSFVIQLGFILVFAVVSWVSLYLIFRLLGFIKDLVFVLLGIYKPDKEE